MTDRPVTDRPVTDRPVPERDARRAAITVDRLRMLAEVARAGTIAGAGRALGVTASAVSQQLSALERDTGIALLDRHGHRVALTAAAQTLVDHAGRVDAALDAAVADLERLRDVVAGTVVVAAVTSASMTFVAAAVDAVAAAHPDVRSVVVDEEPSVSLERLRRGEVDVAVVDRYDDVPLPGLDDLTVTALLDEPVVILAPTRWRAPSRPSRPRGSVGLADLAAQRWVLAPSTAACGDAVRRACRRAGFEPDVVRETDDILAHHRHVAAGHGIAALPRLATEGVEIAVRRLVLDEPRLERRLLAVTRPATVQRPAVAAVLAALDTAAGELRRR